MSASRRARLAFFLVLFACVMTAGGGWFWYRWKFPYGRSHACDTQLMFALRQYAEDQSGMFPAGEATPEASLSLLYPKYADAHVLSGKTVPPEVAQAIFDRGERLGPKTCENTNGLLREFFPKSMDLRSVSHQAVAAAVRNFE